MKDRDLVGGVAFEHEAVMKLISERCNRLLIIISPSFLKSSANKFFLNYAQALSIGMAFALFILRLYLSLTDYNSFKTMYSKNLYFYRKAAEKDHTMYIRKLRIAISIEIYIYSRL